MESKLVRIVAYNDTLAHLVLSEWEDLVATSDQSLAAALYDRVWVAAIEEDSYNWKSNLTVMIKQAEAHPNSPYGYRRVDNTLMLYEPEALVVRLVHMWYVQFSLSLRDIRDELTSLAIPTHHDTHGKYKTSRWGVWDMTAIDTILASEVYIGRWRTTDPMTGSPTVTPVPAILSDSEYQAAQAQRAANTNQPRHKTKYNYLLGHRLTCGMCEATIRLHAKRVNSTVYLYYRCPARGCITQGFRAEDTDEVVWSWLRNQLTHTDAERTLLKAHEQQWKARAADLEMRLNVIDHFLTDYQGQLQRLSRWPASGSFLNAALEGYEGRLHHAVHALARAREQVELEQENHASRRSLDKSDESFSSRRRIVELLDLSAAISGRSRSKKLSVRSRIGSATLTV